MRNALERWRGGTTSPWFRDLDELFEELTPFSTRRETSLGFAPVCDIEETGTHYLMSFDLPGVKKDDIKIDIVDNQLVVSGERKQERKVDEKSRYFAEKTYGRFQRTMTLPAQVNADKIEAQYEHGVLQVAVPKSETAQPRQIKIGEGKGGLFSKILGKTEQEKH